MDQLQKVAEAAIAAHKSSGVQQGGQITVVQLDVTDRAQVSALWSKVPPDLRNVDILGELTSFKFLLCALTNMNFFFLVGMAGPYFRGSQQHRRRARHRPRRRYTGRGHRHYVRDECPRPHFPHPAPHKRFA